MQESEKNIFWFIIFQIAIIFVILFFSILIDKTLLLRCFCCWHSVHFGFLFSFFFYFLFWPTRISLRHNNLIFPKSAISKWQSVFLCARTLSHIFSHTHTHISSSKCLKNRNQLFETIEIKIKRGSFLLLPNCIYFFLSGGWAWKRKK